MRTSRQSNGTVDVAPPRSAEMRPRRARPNASPSPRRLRPLRRSEEDLGRPSMKHVRTRCRSPQPKLLKATRLNVRSGAKNARSRKDSKCHRLPRRCRHRLDGPPREPPTTATGSRRPAAGVTTSCRPRSQYADLEESLPSVRGRSRSFGCGALAGGGSGGKTPSPLQKTHAHGGSTLPGQMPSQSRDHHQRRRRRDLRDATASASADAPERVSIDDTRCGDGVRRTSLHSLAPGVPRTTSAGRSLKGHALRWSVVATTSIVASGCPWCG